MLGQTSGLIYLFIRPSCTTESAIFKMTICGPNPGHRQTYTLLNVGKIKLRRRGPIQIAILLVHTTYEIATECS
jgi:hypothetical protein